MRNIFNEEHKLFRESIAEWIEKEIAPKYDEWEKKKQIPREIWQKLGTLGGLCPMAQEKYGGLDGDFLFQTIVTEELAYRAFSGLLVAIQNDLVFPYIQNFGSEEQRVKWIPKMISGEIITGLAMTEPGVGSNLAGITTKAVKKGLKVFIYGASTKGNTLLQHYEINHKLIEFAAERSPEKWGKYTIGSGVKIISENEARNLNPDYFFVMPYAFIKEFIKREKKWLKRGGKFILPYPNFKIINK